MKLWITRKRHKQSRFLTEENFVKLEFTFLLLVISTFFVALSLPYFVVWCIFYAVNVRSLFFDVVFVMTSSTRLSGLIRITRTIFYLNYSVNFFLYSLTGAHFRRRLAAVLRPKRTKRPRYYCNSFLMYKCFIHFVNKYNNYILWVEIPVEDVICKNKKWIWR